MTRSVGQSLERERQRLAELDRERDGVLASIRALEGQVAAGTWSRSDPVGVASVLPADSEKRVARSQVATADGRVALFAGLFRGRSDVFATRWQSRAGRSGWSPRCANEWVSGVCEKPRVKCAACAHQQFVPFSQAQTRRHLEGRETLGIYPLLADETCWLVAIDFDGASWQEDAIAARTAAGEHDVPVLVERSRSGEGAHVWILFSAPVRARDARTLASWLLTEAMRRRPMSMASYDRLF